MTNLAFYKNFEIFLNEAHAEIDKLLESTKNYMDDYELNSLLTDKIMKEFKATTFNSDGTTSYIFEFEELPGVLVKVMDYSETKNPDYCNESEILKYLSEKYSNEYYVPKFHYGNKLFTVMEKIEGANSLSFYTFSDKEEDYLSYECAMDLLHKLFTITYEDSISMYDLHMENTLIIDNQKAVIIDTAAYYFAEKAEYIINHHFSDDEMKEIIIKGTNGQTTLFDLYQTHKEKFAKVLV